MSTLRAAPRRGPPWKGEGRVTPPTSLSRPAKHVIAETARMFAPRADRVARFLHGHRTSRRRTTPTHTGGPHATHSHQRPRRLLGGPLPGQRPGLERPPQRPARPGDGGTAARPRPRPRLRRGRRRRLARLPRLAGHRRRHLGHRPGTRRRARRRGRTRRPHHLGAARTGPLLPRGHLRPGQRRVPAVPGRAGPGRGAAPGGRRPRPPRDPADSDARRVALVAGGAAVRGGGR
jgi:hypothetical protein